MKIKKLHYQVDPRVSVDSYLDGIRDVLPAVDSLLERHANTRLSDYVEQLGHFNSGGFQGNEDFIAEVAAYTGEVLGPDLAAAISEDLQQAPQVLTANHHGIDTFAQSTQSNLLFSMRKRADGNPVKTIPVLACGSIPLNNLTYPRGLLVYASRLADGNSGISRLPIFPDSHKRKLVSVASPFTPEMLKRARARAQKLLGDQVLDSSLQSALDLVFDDFIGVAGESQDYVRQATLINHRLWRHLFRDSARRSELVYIELETIASRLLQRDLYNASSICHQLFFDPQMRSALIEELNGQRGCWQYERLLENTSGQADIADRNQADAAQGTMFFWGVDKKGRKVPLAITTQANGQDVKLRGYDDSGQLMEIPFTPEGLTRGLQEQCLLPSIFTSYLLIAVARGVSCIGGYYQADYLPVMRRAITATLRQNSGQSVKAIETGKLRPDLYLSGMQMIGLKTAGQILPAGPLEIIASGGIDSGQYQRLGEVSVLQSHIASLYDTFMDVVPRCDHNQHAKQEICRLVRDAVGAEILTISMH